MTDLWTEASRDTEREQREQRFTAARVAVAPLWPFLAGAVSETDFENRLAVSADKIDAVCERLAEGAEFTALRRQVHTALQRDYAILAEAAAEERRQAFLERKRARLAAQRKKAEAESDLQEGTHVEPRSSEESRADGKGNPVDDTRHAGNTPEGGDHVGPKEDCPVCSGGSKESAKVASGPPIIPDNVGARDMSPKTLAQQIGTMNIMAISGGRVTPITGKGGRYVGIRMPVSNGYAVDVYLADDDTYTVQRVFRGRVMGQQTGVYADQVGEAAYQAGMFRSNQFGASKGPRPFEVVFANGQMDSGPPAHPGDSRTAGRVPHQSVEAVRSVRQAGGGRSFGDGAPGGVDGSQRPGAGGHGRASSVPSQAMRSDRSPAPAGARAAQAGAHPGGRALQQPEDGLQARSSVHAGEHPDGPTWLPSVQGVYAGASSRVASKGARAFVFASDLKRQATPPPGEAWHDGFEDGYSQSKGGDGGDGGGPLYELGQENGQEAGAGQVGWDTATMGPTTLAQRHQAGKYCKTHQVWIGEGNASNHDEACKIEEKSTEASLHTAVIEDLRTRLMMAVTQYDRREEKRGKGYNPYALPQYMRAIGDAMQEIEAGAPVEETLSYHFSGRLLDVVLKAAAESPPGGVFVRGGEGSRIAGLTCPSCGDSNYTNRMDGSKRCDSCGHEWDPEEETSKEGRRRTAGEVPPQFQKKDGGDSGGESSGGGDDKVPPGYVECATCQGKRISPQMPGSWCPTCNGTGITAEVAQQDPAAPAPAAPAAQASLTWTVPSSSSTAGNTLTYNAGFRATAPGGIHAPYRIEQRGGDWVVVNDIGEVKGTHDSEAQAREQQKALYANVEGAPEMAERKHESMRKGAPFADYEDFDDCTRQNSDKDDPDAYCGRIKHDTEDQKQGRRVTAAQCRQCGKQMNPVDAMVGGGKNPICGSCARRNAKEVTGRHQAVYGDEYEYDEQSYNADQALENLSPDNCPVCGLRITDHGDEGVEAPNGQRWCHEHKPANWREGRRRTAASTPSDVLEAIRDMDPDGGETMPTQADYDRFEQRVRQRYGDQAWRDYKGWGNQEEDLYNPGADDGYSRSWGGGWGAD